MKYVRVFAMCLEQFLEDLCLTFPDEKNLRYYRQYATSLLSLQPSIALQYFNRFVMPFKDHIAARDEAFFLDRDYDEEENAASANTGNADMLQAIRLKDLWRTMSEDSKGKTWKYLQHMVTAADGAAQQ